MTTNTIERFADQLRRDAETADDGVAVGLLRAADGIGDLLAAEPRQPDLADLRERFAALAALEEHIGESCENSSHNIRSVLDGSYDPRPDADRLGLDYRNSSRD